MTKWDTDNLSAPHTQRELGAEPAPAVDVSTEAVMRLLDGVTPGPWRPSRSYRGAVSDSQSGYDDAESVHAYGGHMICESIMDHNMAFICASRDLVPALLVDRDRLADEVARLREALADALKEGMRIATCVPIEQVQEAFSAALRAIAEPGGR